VFSNSPGQRNVSIITAFGSSNSLPFTMDAPTPTITSLTPNSVMAGAATFNLTVKGTNYLAGASVRWNSSTLSTTVNSATQLTAAVPASLVASPGTANITVVNTTGAPSSPARFTINTPPFPTATSLSPSSATAGGPAFTLTITGSGIVAGASVYWSGTNLAGTVAGSTQVSATIPASLILESGAFDTLWEAAEALVTGI
jgi:hypothetical protein